MKKTILSIALTILTFVSANAQLTEGHVQYSIDLESDNPDMEMAISMMQGSTLDLYFSGTKSRTEMSMGSMMTISTVTDANSDEVLMLMSGMIGKKAVKSSLKELEEESSEKPSFEVELVDETKKIEGYLCKKAVLTDDDDNEMIFWYTEEIEVNKKGQNYLNEDVPGFPMEFEINQGEMIMSMTVEKFEDSLDDDSVFDITIPEGYDVMTMEELKMMGM